MQIQYIDIQQIDIQSSWEVKTSQLFYFKWAASHRWKSSDTHSVWFLQTGWWVKTVLVGLQLAAEPAWFVHLSQSRGYSWGRLPLPEVWEWGLSSWAAGVWSSAESVMFPLAEMLSMPQSYLWEDWQISQSSVNNSLPVPLRPCWTWGCWGKRRGRGIWLERKGRWWGSCPLKCWKWLDSRPCQWNCFLDYR